MSGGIAYVFDEDAAFADRCNHELVDLESVEPEDETELHALIEYHAAATGSAVATRVLANWARAVRTFVKVMPRDYRRAVIGASAYTLAPAANG